MKAKPKKSKKSKIEDMPMHLVGLMLTFSNVVRDLKTLTGSMEILAKKLSRAMENGTVGHEKSE